MNEADVSCFLGRLEQAIEDEVNTVRSDLQRGKDLLSDAVNLLQDSQRGVADKHQKVQSLLAELNRNSEDVDMSAELDGMIKALQVEDIIRQLSDHILERLGHLHELSVLTGRVMVGDLINDEALARANDSLQAINDRAQKTSQSRAVTQGSMDEGDIELF